MDTLTYNFGGRSTSNYKGKDCLIPYIELHSLEGELLFILCHQQFPVCLCFAMTVNKSQGQSLLIVGIDLQFLVFSHG